MTVSLTINGQTFDYPGPGPDEEWGPEATDWATAVTTGMLQKAGGLFTLLDEVDFGTTFGLKSVYYKTRSSNIASAGQFRLARTDGIYWRNEANSADLALGVDSSNRLTFNGTIIQQSLSVSDTSTIDLTLAADVLSADIVAGSITNSMINASAAIAYSKLNLTGSILNADINASAAIAYSKLATLTTGRALVSDGSGFVSVSAVTSTELGYVSGVTSSIQTQLNGKIAPASFTAKGDLLVGTGVGTFAALPVGADGTVLTADSGEASGYTFTAPLTNPMTTSQDIIVGGVSGAANRLGIGASNTVLRESAGTLGYGLLVDANIDSAAAIAGTKVSPNFGSQNIVTTGTLAARATTLTPASGSTGLTVTGGGGTSSTDINMILTHTVTGSNVGVIAQFKSVATTYGQIFVYPTNNTVSYAGGGNFGLNVDNLGNTTVGLRHDGAVGADLTFSAFATSTTNPVALFRNTNSSSGTLQVVTIRKDVTASATPGNLVFARFESSGGASNGIIANANATTLQFSTPSDLRLKSNITPIDNCLELVTALNPVKFDIDGYRQSGFIAQEMYEVLPEFVTKTDNGIDELVDREKAWSISSPAYVTYLVGAIKELSQRVIALEGQVNP